MQRVVVHYVAFISGLVLVAFLPAPPGLETLIPLSHGEHTGNGTAERGIWNHGLQQCPPLCHRQLERLSQPEYAAYSWLNSNKHGL